MHPPILLPNALTHPDALARSLDWQPFRPGVQIAHVYKSEAGGPAMAFLKYDPGARIPLHRHAGHEHIFILQGSQVDRSGHHHAGAIIINPPDSEHEIFSPDGCLVLILWEKPIIPLPT